MRHKIRSLAMFGLAALVVGAAMLATPRARAAEEVNVYSFRQEVLIRPLLDAFTAETGIAVNLLSAKEDALLERLKTEGRNSPADILMTADAGRLYRAKEAGVLQPVQTSALDALIPAHYRDPEGYWFGLSVRARPIMYAKGRVDPAALDSYDDLADPTWRGKVCIRSSNSIYNQSMLAAMIAHVGPEKTEQWAEGLVANFARKPVGGDRDQIRAVAAGECDVAVANTYYLGRLATSSDEGDQAAAEAIGIVWPDQDGAGVHVNISGAGVAAYAPNKDNALRLLEFLAGDEAQKTYADTVMEYPIRDDIPPAPVVAAWGTFKADTLNLSVLGENNAEAVRIADRAGWR